MARQFSPTTLLVYRLVAERPLVSAQDILGMTSLPHKNPETTIGNVLMRGQKAGLLRSASLGWEHRAVDRYVVTSNGKERLCQLPEFKDCAWPTEWDIELLARLGPFVEMVYRVLPALFQTNLSKGRVLVPKSGSALNSRLERIESRVLEESNWRRARLVDLRWLPEGLEPTERSLLHHPFSLIAVYEKDAPGDGRFYLPVGWKGRYQRWQEFQDLRSKMESILAQRRDWHRISHSYQPRYHPGGLFICSDRVSGVLARNFTADQLAVNPDMHLTMGIVDLQGHVLQSLQTPSAMWESVTAPLPGDPFGEPELVMAELETGKVAAVTGKERWTSFKALADFPGIRPDQVRHVAGTSKNKAADIIRPMLKLKLVSKLEGGFYLESPGRRILADSERVSVQRVTKQLGVFTRKKRDPSRRRSRPKAAGSSPGPSHRQRQRRHHQGTVDIHVALGSQGELVIPGQGRYIDYRGVRIVPDHFILLPIGERGSDWVLAALEYERYARKPGQVLEKAKPYIKMARAGRPIPVLFVTDTEEAAVEFVRLEVSHLLATNIGRLQAGPQGRAAIDIQDGTPIAAVEPGCWGYRSTNGTPTFTAPINLWPASESYPHWTLPADNLLRLVYEAGPRAEIPKQGPGSAVGLPGADHPGSDPFEGIDEETRQRLDEELRLAEEQDAQDAADADVAEAMNLYGPLSGR